ncbi:hypothetical protein K7X08_031396 [Anisodus acutangulus]|uniref:Uncharacterized protein n=1 Tax=Anisodus acutangulus TaxID=402998 RepID=A0A9Q1MM88_9SOLA|nr:hypothetical protein K7X08_031396 [Anisodus acutangulus]
MKSHAYELLFGPSLCNGSCIYPGSGGRNGTFTNSSSNAPSTNSTSSGCHSQYSQDVRIFLSSLIVDLIICTAAFL